jgi:membrane protease YdiL (CAAX protease family)
MYLFVSGPVQEFTYRAVPFAELDRYEKIPPWIKILIINLNFAWLHVIYFDWIIYVVAFLIGLIWTSIYYHKKNLWAVSIAHAICGFLAIWFGLI